MRNWAAFWIVLFFTISSLAQQSKKAVNWDSWEFLIGEWTGEGSGTPGQGIGGFSFSFDLGKQILVRKSRTDFPAAEGRPVFSHEDLMIIFQEQTKPVRAVYFDNEGHIIYYSAEVFNDQNRWTFTSDPVVSAPTFRLTYIKKPDGFLNIQFEMAPPGKPGVFSTYIQGDAYRE